ncbi:hypothetical protein BH20ACT13_BH20ACT13_08780 [soil metagenome]
MRLSAVLSTGRLASASARHPWRVVGAWIAVFALAVVAIVTLLGDGLSTDDAPTNNPESEQAIAAQIQAFPPDPTRMPRSDIVVIRSDRHTVDSPEFESFVRTLVVESDVLALSRADTYLDGDASLVSGDRHATIVPLGIHDEDEAEAVIETVEQADEEAAFSVAVTGEQTLDYDFNLLSQEDLEKGELQFGLPAALIILLLVFGAVVAGLIPLLMAIVSIVVALGMTALLAQPFELSVFIVNMLTGMGLALGLDYSLFVVSRYREERWRGREHLDAIAASGLTASRAVLFSGTAFVVAMFGMLLVPSSIMRSLAVGAILVGVVSVAAALTLLPALLGLLGDRINSLRIPIVGRRTLASAGAEGRFWGAIVRSVLRRPVLSLALSLGVLVAMALPILAMNVGTSGVCLRSLTASPPSEALSRWNATSPRRRPTRSRSWFPEAPRVAPPRRRSLDCARRSPPIPGSAAARFGAPRMVRSRFSRFRSSETPRARRPSQRCRSSAASSCRRRSRAPMPRYSSVERRRRTSTTSTL